MLGFINTPERKIWTAEDPVEITQHGLRQVQVNPKIGFNFASAMRAFLRADPDVIMVGEMRDEETASVGIEASLTGHLVLSTLHTNSAPGDGGPAGGHGLRPLQLLGRHAGHPGPAAGQAPVRRLPRELPAHARSSTRRSCRPTEPRSGRRAGSRTTAAFKLFRGRGCDKCGKSGYKGRAAIHELLVTSRDIKRLIQTRARATEILAARQDGGDDHPPPGRHHKAMAGVTDVKQVKAVANA